MRKTKTLGPRAAGSPSLLHAVFVLILTYCHESWVMIERVLSQAPAAEMRFLRRSRNMQIRDKVRNCEIRKSLNLETFLLRMEISQITLIRAYVPNVPGRLAKQVLLATPTGKLPRVRPRTRWRDYIFDLAGLPLRGASRTLRDSC